MIVLNVHLQCEGLRDFGEKGDRLNIPHYILQWIRYTLSETCIDHTSNIPSKDSMSSFFSKYENSFRGGLSDVVFNVVLSTLIEKMSDMSSEQLLLLLLRSLEIEYSLKREEQTRSCRIRAHKLQDNIQEPFTGSPMSILILEAMVVCFGLKVSYELARDGSASALTRIYSTIELISRVMLIQGTRWKEVFFLNMIRVSGQACLMKWFDSNDLFQDFTWSTEWKNGLPKLKQGIEENLAKAESDLQETVREEQRKEKEVRLCPHCGQHSMIIAMICGKFVCGRHDTHITPKGINGRGLEFEVRDAIVRNEEKLVRLRSKVEKEKQNCDQYADRSQLWDVLKKSSLPCLTSTLLTDCFALTVLITEVIDCDLLRHILSHEKFVKAFAMLPDMIEVRICIRGTLRACISKFPWF